VYWLDVEGTVSKVNWLEESEGTVSNVCWVEEGCEAVWNVNWLESSVTTDADGVGNDTPATGGGGGTGVGLPLLQTDIETGVEAEEADDGVTGVITVSTSNLSKPNPPLMSTGFGLVGTPNRFLQFSIQSSKVPRTGWLLDTEPFTAAVLLNIETSSPVSGQMVAGTVPSRIGWTGRSIPWSSFTHDWNGFGLAGVGPEDTVCGTGHEGIGEGTGPGGTGWDPEGTGAGIDGHEEGTGSGTGGEGGLKGMVFTGVPAGVLNGVWGGGKVSNALHPGGGGGGEGPPPQATGFKQPPGGHVPNWTGEGATGLGWTGEGVGRLQICSVGVTCMNGSLAKSRVFWEIKERFEVFPEQVVFVGDTTFGMFNGDTTWGVWSIRVGGKWVGDGDGLTHWTLHGRGLVLSHGLLCVKLFIMELFSGDPSWLSWTETPAWGRGLGKGVLNERDSPKSFSWIGDNAAWTRKFISSSSASQLLKFSSPKPSFMIILGT
jgi:hypothetical protein